ncbi:MAG: hypothetical protein AABX33_08430 [Nanoarchaeota archaeon]
MKKLYSIIVFVFILFFLTGCNSGKTKKNDSKSTAESIHINEMDRDCSFDSDCVYISTHCGDCEGDVVNKVREKRLNLFAVYICRNYKGPECDLDYRPVYDIKCVNQECRLVPKT